MFLRGEIIITVVDISEVIVFLLVEMLTHNHLCYSGEFLRAVSFLAVAFHSGFAKTVIASLLVLADSLARILNLIRVLAFVDVCKQQHRLNTYMYPKASSIFS
jgi:hypothetical protein